MKFSYCLVLTTLFTICQVTGQVMFQRIYSQPCCNGIIANNVILTEDSSYVLVCGIKSGLMKTNLSGDTIWTKHYDGLEGFNQVTGKLTSDSGFIVAGISHFNNSICLIKANSVGDTLWSRSYGCGNSAISYSVNQTSDSGFIITGLSDSSSTSTSDIYIIRTNHFGDTVWTRNLGGPGSEQGVSGIQTPDGGFIVVGATNYMNDPTILVKLNSNGDTMWSKSFLDTWVSSSSCLSLTSDSGFILTGSFKDSVPGSKSLLLKIDSAGNIQWSKTYHYSNGFGSYSFGTSVIQTSDGGYVFTGMINDQGGNGAENLWLVRTDQNGDTLWTKIFYGYQMDFGQDVKQTYDGGFIVAGYTQYWTNGFKQIYLIKTDQSGSSGCYESNQNTVVGSPGITITQPTILVNQTNTFFDSYDFGADTIGLNYFNSPCFENLVEESHINYFFIYPNPISSLFTINPGDQFQNTFLEIFTILGEQIYMSSFCGQLTVDCAHFPQGLYFVTLKTPDGIQVQKLIKQ